MENQDQNDQNNKHGQQQPRDDNSVQNQQTKRTDEDTENDNSDLAGNASGNRDDDAVSSGGRRTDFAENSAEKDSSLASDGPVSQGEGKDGADLDDTQRDEDNEKDAE